MGFLLSRLVVSVVILFVSFSSTAIAQQAGITSPATGASASGSIPIFGTATIDPFQKYELHYKLEPSGDDAYIYFDGTTTPVTNGQLGVLQAGAFAPGTYSIRLRVVKSDGNYAEYFAQNVSINQAEPTAVNVAPTATPLTVGAIGAVVTPTFTPPSLAPTVTPVPTLTFTPAPQPTPAVGQVTQPQTTILPTNTPFPTSTPVQVAAVIEAPEQNTDSAVVGVVNPDVNPDAVTNVEAVVSNELNVAADGAVSTGASGTSASITRQLGETLALNRLQRYFLDGMRYSATIVLLIALLFVAKRLFRWVRSQA